MSINALRMGSGFMSAESGSDSFQLDSMSISESSEQKTPITVITVTSAANSSGQGSSIEGGFEEKVVAHDDSTAADREKVKAEVWESTTPEGIMLTDYKNGAWEPGVDWRTGDILSLL